VREFGPRLVLNQVAFGEQLEHRFLWGKRRGRERAGMGVDRLRRGFFRSPNRGIRSAPRWESM